MHNSKNSYNDETFDAINALGTALCIILAVPLMYGASNPLPYLSAVIMGMNIGLMFSELLQTRSTKHTIEFLQKLLFYPTIVSMVGFFIIITSAGLTNSTMTPVTITVFGTASLVMVTRFTWLALQKLFNLAFGVTEGTHDA